MPTYKTTKPITESFLEKLFTSVGKGLRSSMVKQLVKKDPELGKRIKDLEKTRDWSSIYKYMDRLQAYTFDIY